MRLYCMLRVYLCGVHYCERGWGQRARAQVDVVGFHTYNHARHFLQACRRVLGLQYQAREGRVGVEKDGRDIMVSISHVGVKVGPRCCCCRRRRRRRAGTAPGHIT